MIELYDTGSGRVRPLATREPAKVSIYACGPTVYDHPHLGHARSALTYDVLRRYLEWRGLEVRLVANVTDIDDKIIARANSEGLTEPEVAAEWDAVYVESMEALGIRAPHERPRATQWVNEMVELISDIMAADRAYATPTGVYLRVRDIDDYCALVHRDLDDLRASAGARVQVDEAKEDPLDFALWKAAKPGEPTWPSPWGPGRPGWHIECAAMSLGILGDGFDLHGGGADLVFPHHTNERAEASAAGREFARHWMHNAMLNIDGVKMAKSLGNYRTVAALLDENPLNGRAFRLLVLQTHYRKTMEVNADLLASARAAVRRLDSLARRASALGLPVEPCKTAQADTAGKAPGESGDIDGREQAQTLESRRPARSDETAASRGRADGEGGEAEAADPVSLGAGPLARVCGSSRAAAAVNAFRSAMDNDLGTPEAVAVLFDTLHIANAALDDGADDALALVEAVADLAGALGLPVDAGHGSADGHDVALIEDLVQRREAARQARDWTAADALRADLTSLGVVVEDTPAGPLWRMA